MKLSYSRINTFKNCPFQYDLKYNKQMETIFNCDPQNPLIIGHALHTGLEKTVDEAINEYYNSYPIINDLHINEAIKLEYLIPKVKAILPLGEHEVKIEDEDFIGFIDLLVPVENDKYDIYDFKYSNNIDHYKESEQLHLYKYFFEKLNPTKQIRKLYYVFIPKTMIRQKKTEQLFEFRQRLFDTLSQMEVKIEEVTYDSSRVIEYLLASKHCIECKDYTKNPTKLCSWCEYKNYCEKGEMIDMLPKNERVPVGSTNFMKGWIYGPPFSGKTTFLDQSPDPLNLNTDGNTKYVTMQRIRIRDEVTVNGRLTETKFAWEVFKEAIDELEKYQNDFKTIIVDLVEDTREMCRLYMYDILKIQHESDSGFGKGWDVIKTEYLSTMRRLLSLDYNIFLVSHEDISKDLTKKSGDKITRISPNIQEAIANKLAGMVDFVARVIVEDDDSRKLSFKANEVTFGGGRLHIKDEEIPLDWNELMKVYEKANEESVVEIKKTEESKKEETPSKTEETELPKRKTRKKKEA